MPDRIFLGSPQWLWYVVAILVVMVLLVVAVYRFNESRSKSLFLAAILKIVAIVALLICLLEPLGSVEKPRSQANIFPLIVDNSQSMTIGSLSGGKEKSEQLTELLADETSWQVRLAQDFQVKRYLFDGKLASVETFSKLGFDGLESALGSSLRTLATRYSKQPVAGILLFSDGNATDSPLTQADWKSLGFPVYPVTLPSPNTLKDLSIARISVGQTDFEASPVTLDIELAHRGLPSQKCKLFLFDEQNKLLQEQLVDLGAEAKPISARFQFRPESSGVRSFKVTARIESESANSGSDTTNSIEATLANNTRFAVVNRDRGPYRVLYVAGRPNWEFKFLRRALEEDEEIKLISLLRIANKEPKFTFRDGRVDSANPLFSGFDNKDPDASEQYDEPVLIRLGVEESEQLSSGFPKSAEELFSYQAIILDDLEHEFFSQEQLLLLRQFVSMRGGGLLMLGGTESLKGKGLRESQLGDVLPVYPAMESKGPFAASGQGATARLNLTREGWLQPWLRVEANEEAERMRLEKMPAMEVLNQVAGTKPGTSTLLELVNEAGEVRPALVTQQFGKGRSAALLVGDLWRWGMHHQGEGAPALFPAWRQMVRWLIADVPRRVDSTVDLRASTSSRSALIRVQVKDEKFLPLDNATVNLTVQPPEGETFTMIARPSSKEPGVYEAVLLSRSVGPYKVEIAVTAPDGSEVGSHQNGWVSEPAAEEFSAIDTNEELLATIASETGGEVVPSDQLDQFIGSLENRKVPVADVVVFPLWHQSWVLLIAIASLCGEWGLRRWRGMA